MIYLNKINQRQIFERSAFKQIMDSVCNPELLIQILDNYICQSIAYSSAQDPNYLQRQNQQGQNVISNLSIEAHMNVYNRNPDQGQPQVQTPWANRIYVREKKRNVSHVRIAYFINQQITKVENRDPLEYFEHYRKTNNE
jgi:hypothetical protein